MSAPLSLHDTRIGVRVPIQTRKLAEQAARAAGWSLSDWLRTVIETAAEIELQEAAAARERDNSPPPRTFLRRRPGT